jgi:2-dehydro-3-deoxyphosphooctonate aldolase (KDO 8-P synthase)
MPPRAKPRSLEMLGVVIAVFHKSSVGAVALFDAQPRSNPLTRQPNVAILQMQQPAKLPDQRTLMHLADTVGIDDLPHSLDHADAFLMRDRVLDRTGKAHEIDRLGLRCLALGSQGGSLGGAKAKARGQNPRNPLAFIRIIGAIGMGRLDQQGGQRGTFVGLCRTFVGLASDQSFEQIYHRVNIGARLRRGEANFPESTFLPFTGVSGFTSHEAPGFKTPKETRMITEPAETISIGETRIANNLPFALIAGPCQAEGVQHSLDIAGPLAELCAARGIALIFKASFDKANRTSLSGARGLGMEKGLECLAEVRRQIGCPVLSDVHEAAQCAPVAEVVDVLQIPALLCRQTDLLLAAGATGRAINVKKGQFMAPWDMANVATKIASTGNRQIMLCERGTSFGYNTLVSDFRGLPVMAASGFPVIFDATHSVQQPSGLGGASGGQREFAPVLARAAAAVGVAGFFVETHPDPDNAPCDGPVMIYLNKMGEILDTLIEIDRIAKTRPISLG